MTDSNNESDVKRTYRWPWVVLGFFLLGVVLAVIAVRKEVERVRERRAPWLEQQGTSGVSTNTQ